MSKYASITLSIDYFHFHPTAQLVPDLILTLCQTKIAERESFYHSDFLSSRKFNIFANFSKIRDFSSSSRNEAKEFGFLFLLSNVEKLFLNFSFSIGLFCISSMTASTKLCKLVSLLVLYISVGFPHCVTSSTFISSQRRTRV